MLWVLLWVVGVRVGIHVGGVTREGHRRVFQVWFLWRVLKLFRVQFRVSERVVVGIAITASAKPAAGMGCVSRGVVEPTVGVGHSFPLVKLS